MSSVWPFNKIEMIGKVLAGERQLTPLQHKVARLASQHQELTLTIAPCHAGGCRYITDVAEALQLPSRGQ